MTTLQSLAILLALELLGLGLIWLLLQARLRRALELETFVEGVRREVRGLEIELNEAADRSVSLVEDRLESLRTLLEDADRRILVHRRELGNRKAEAEIYDRLGRRSPEAASSPARRTPASLPVSAEALPEAGGEDRGEDPFEAADRGGADPIRLDLARRLPEATRSRESVIPPRPLRERALELHDRGFSPDLIATRLGATVAEIELLVSIEEGRRAGS